MEQDKLDHSIIRLSIIQKELKAPKGQFNSFGGYHYRSCEDILEALKPLLLEGEVITLADEIVNLGDRYYVKSSARLNINGVLIENTAYAREEITKKGMDASQITGSASSYARKYALNGLLAIDDVKDADTQDNTTHVTEKPAPLFQTVAKELGVECKLHPGVKMKMATSKKTGKPYHYHILEGGGMCFGRAFSA